MVIAPPVLSPPPSARTTHKPVYQSVHRRFLSAVRTVLYLAPSSNCGTSPGVRACSQREKRVYRAGLFLLSLRFMFSVGILSPNSWVRHCFYSGHFYDLFNFRSINLYSGELKIKSLKAVSNIVNATSKAGYKERCIVFVISESS